MVKKKRQDKKVPDSMRHGANADRAEWARAALEAFAKTTGLTMRYDGLTTVIKDLLADLHHLCDRESLDMDSLIRSGEDYYREETMDICKKCHARFDGEADGIEDNGICKGCEEIEL